ncbi:MAG: hypothetical protein LBQ93_04895 [Treponema sp.]|jgi:hypothetical protein|nr:hypothetical protein [Treponema sp.]
MKKLIFLLLMAVVFACIVPAWDIAHPPGDFFPEAVLTEYSVQQDVVTQSAVLVWFMPLTVEPSSFQAVMALYNESAIQPQISGIIIISSPFTILGWSQAVSAADDYYLRC